MQQTEGVTLLKRLKRSGIDTSGKSLQNSTGINNDKSHVMNNKLCPQQHSNTVQLQKLSQTQQFNERSSAKPPLNLKQTVLSDYNKL
jgi:hypothetical protein